MLQNDTKHLESSIYEIIIGGDVNTRSFIGTNQKAKYTSFEKDLLSESEFRAFWITWKDGNIKVGQGPVVNENIFLEWADPDFIEVTSVTVSSGNQGDGYWRFPMGKGTCLC